MFSEYFVFLILKVIMITIPIEIVFDIYYLSGKNNIQTLHCQLLQTLRTLGKKILFIKFKNQKIYSFFFF